MHQLSTTVALSAQAPAILVFRSALLGDFILASPALTLLRKLYPQHRIVLLTTPSANKAIRDSAKSYSPADRTPWVKLAMPHLIDEVVALDLDFKPGYLWSIRKQLRAYRPSSIFMLVDPGAPWPGRIKKWALLSLLAGPAPIYGWRAMGSLNGDRARLHAQGHLPHHVHGPLHFAKELSPPLAYGEQDVTFDLRAPVDARTWAMQWMADNVPPGRRAVFVAPASIQPHKRWPVESFRSLLEQLHALHEDLHFVIIGTAGDREIGQVLRDRLPGHLSIVAGQCNIAQSAALLQLGSLLVGNDGGAMHLGDAMGTRVVSIVPGIEYPNSIEPWNNRHRAVRHPVPCAPCYSFTVCPQGHSRCMTDLPVQAVLDRCIEALAEDTQTPRPSAPAAKTRPAAP